MDKRTSQKAEGQTYENLRSFSFSSSGMMRNSRVSYWLCRESDGVVRYECDLPRGFDKRQRVRYDPGEAEFAEFLRLAREGQLIETLQEQCPEDAIRMTDSSSAFSVDFRGRVPPLTAYRGAPVCGDLVERLRALAEGHEAEVYEESFGLTGSMEAFRKIESPGVSTEPPAPEAEKDAPKRWVFCPECGTKNTGRVCRECGAKLSWPCPKCGKRSDGKFCPECGTKLR